MESSTLIILPPYQVVKLNQSLLSFPGAMLSKEKLCFHPLLLFIILFLLSTTICHAIYAETINSTHYLRDGQTIISTGGNFKLGFFCPSNSKNRYLGIWFAKIVQQTVVWVANRENPIQDSSGTFKIGIDGNLVLVDGNENVVWSSNISILSNSSIGEILDSGNLILRQGDSNGAETILWQSFDHPSDTFLAGMKFGLNLKTGENQLLTAWRNANNPSAGKFSLGFDPNGIAQIVIWNGSHRHYRSGQWNGQQFVGVPEMTSYQLYGFNIINDTEEGRLYSLYSQFKSTISAFVLSPNGELERQYWDDDKSAWAVVWSQPISECEMYGRCGLNGVCSKNKSPICSCLKGFVPSSPQNWKTGNWSEGCIRQRQLACQEDQGTSRDDVFLKISGIKLPDESQSVAVDGIEKCKVICKKNCSCLAFAYPSGLGCLTWYGDLKDLQLFPNGGQDLYFRLAKSRLKGILKMKKAALGLLVILLGVIVTIFFGISMWRKMTKNNGTDEEENNQGALMLDLGTMENLNRSYLDGNELEAVVNKRNGHCPETPLFSFNMLRTATNDFSVANKLGEGGFGPIYKGKLPNGQEIAVKRLLKVSGQRLLEFENEVILVAKLQHRNLVRLLGYCIQEENLLIYEYMPNKSLDIFLFDPLKQAQLDWRKRFDIIEGVARGLLYLHHDSRLKIIHRDLKASNILLDEDMNSKISDFGIARIFGGQQNQDNTVRVAGTYGYMSPEYAMEGIFSVKSDIFSFGVLLLEIVSGRMNAHFHHPEKLVNLLGYAWELWKDDKMLELVDPNLCMSSLSAEMSRCIRVGLLCVQDNAADRPTMDSVVFMLGSEAAVLSPPKKPSFSLGRTPRLMDILDISTSTGNVSTNIITLSMVLRR